jgi:hypothetical protein
MTRQCKGIDVNAKVLTFLACCVDRSPETQDAGQVDF